MIFSYFSRNIFPKIFATKQLGNLIFRNSLPNHRSIRSTSWKNWREERSIFESTCSKWKGLILRSQSAIISYPLCVGSLRNSSKRSPVLYLQKCFLITFVVRRMKKKRVIFSFSLHRTRSNTTEWLRRYPSSVLIIYSPTWIFYNFPSLWLTRIIFSGPIETNKRSSQVERSVSLQLHIIWIFEKFNYLRRKYDRVRK